MSSFVLPFLDYKPRAVVSGGLKIDVFSKRVTNFCWPVNLSTETIKVGISKPNGH